MKAYVVSGAVVLLVGVLLWQFLGSTAHITNYPPKNETIVAFGDSLVFGQGATKGNDFVSLLGEKLGKEIVNRGVSGNTTQDGLNRMEEVLQEDPGIVILLLGGNDYLRKVPEEMTKKNLGTLIETFQKNGSVVVLLGVRGGILQDGREGMYEDLSKKYGTVYVPDVLDGVFLKPELMADGIHPNDKGYTIIAERLFGVFKDKELVK
jgi:acyl-CoA thioesterase-1